MFRYVLDSSFSMNSIRHKCVEQRALYVMGSNKTDCTIEPALHRMIEALADSDINVNVYTLTKL